MPRMSYYDTLKSEVAHALYLYNHGDLEAFRLQRNAVTRDALRYMSKGAAGYAPKWAEQLVKMYEGKVHV